MKPNQVQFTNSKYQIPGHSYIIVHCTSGFEVHRDRPDIGRSTYLYNYTSPHVHWSGICHLPLPFPLLKERSLSSECSSISFSVQFDLFHLHLSSTHTETIMYYMSGIYRLRTGLQIANIEVVRMLYVFIIFRIISNLGFMCGLHFVSNRYSKRDLL